MTLPGRVDQQVRERTECTIGSLYSNFASKTDLHMALMERRMKRPRKRTEEAFLRYGIRVLLTQVIDRV